MENQHLLDKIIEVYISTEEYKNQKQDVRELLKEIIRDKVSKEIIEIEKDKIVKKAEEEIDRKEEIRKKKQMKIIVIETLILGFLIGLLANQGTDIITYIKGGTNINIELTLICIAILILANLLFGFLMYINKLDEIFNFNKK